MAAQMSRNERAALLSLPARDRGDLPEDLWWAYYSILDQGLAMSADHDMITVTPLGEAVLRLLQGETCTAGGEHSQSRVDEIAQD
jgi:hypothetical protein